MSMRVHTHPRRVMRMPEVQKSTGFKKTHLYNMMKDGRFPQARKIGPRAVGWDSAEVEAWVAARLDGEA